MAKRSNGDGSIGRLSSGKWRGQVMDGYKPNGKRNIVSFTAPTKGEVQQLMRRHLEGIDLEEDVECTMPTFSEWADRWYKDYDGQVQPSTYSGYQYTLKILKNGFGNTPIDQIRAMHISNFLDSLKRTGSSESKVHKCRTMLIQIFDAAAANDLVDKNPGRLAKANRCPFTQEESSKDAFTNKEISMLMTRLPNDLLGNSIRTMLGTGIRVQELLALRPCDIAADGSSIRIDKAIKMVDGRPVLGPPKSKRSKRIIPVPEAYRIYAKAIREEGGQAFIWSSRRDSLLYSVGTFRNRFYKEIEKIPGVRKLSPHCCRHTYVTMLQAKGVPMETIAALTGHSDIKTTAGYLHQSADTLAKAVEVLNGKVAS